MLVQNNQIRHLIRATRLRKLTDDVIPAVDAMRVGEHQAHLFRELEELGAWVSRGRDDDLGIQDPCPGVFAVDVRRRVCSYISRGAIE